MTLLSLCMIVRDEEDVLDRCLASVKDIAEEIIIVDTGSKDATKDIASRYTSKIYDFEWIDDFSAAKNEALNHATGKWILVLDADEYLEPEDIPAMKAFLQKEKPKESIVYNMPIINFTGKSISKGNVMESSADRLFPNRMGIVYQRPIHEQLQSERRGVTVHFTPVPFRIYHTGYIKDVIESKKKSERNMAILNKYKSKNKLLPYDYFTIGNEYQAVNNLEEAYTNYKRGLEGATGKEAWYPHCIISFIQTLIALDRLVESWQVIETRLTRFKQYPEYHFIKGLHYEHFGWFEEAIACYEETVKVAESRAKKERNFWIFSPDYGSKLPLIRLMRISFKLNRYNAAVSWLSKLWMNQQHDLAILVRLLECMSPVEPATSIQSLMDKVYNSSKVVDNARLFQAALAIGHEELASHYYQLLLDNSHEFGIAEEMRYAVISQDRNRFDLLVKQTLNEDHYMIHQVILAAITWNDSTILNRATLPSEHIHSHTLAQVTQFLENRLEWIDKDSEDAVYNHWFLIAKDLFLMKQYDAFDRFMAAFDHPHLVNAMANYFYTCNYMELAFNYYSILLKKQQVDRQGFENLGWYHYENQIPEDAAEFLEQALLLHPDSKDLYYPLVQSLTDPSRKEGWTTRFSEKFPQFIELPFIKSFYQS